MLSTFLLTTQPNNNTFGYNQAVGILTGSQALIKANATAWDNLWKDVLTTNSQLWTGLVGIGQIFIVIGIVWTIYKNSDEIFQQGKYELQPIIKIMLPFLFIGILMLNDGAFLVNIIKLTRTVSYYEISQLYQKQVMGLTLQQAVQSIGQTQTANTATRQIFADCIGKTGQDLQACLSSQDKVDALQILVKSVLGALPGNFATQLCGLISQCSNTPVSVIQGVQQGLNPSQILSNLFSSPFIAIAQAILQALQWAVVNSLELALLLTALFAPLAVGMSALPIAGRMFWTWASGFLGILSINLGYAVLTGLMAITVFSITSASGNPSGVQGIPELISDLGFLLFAAIVSPLLAAGVGTFGGISLYNGISRAANDIAKGITNSVVNVVKIAAL